MGTPEMMDKIKKSVNETVRQCEAITATIARWFYTGQAFAVNGRAAGKSDHVNCLVSTLRVDLTFLVTSYGILFRALSPSPLERLWKDRGEMREIIDLPKDWSPETYNTLEMKELGWLSEQSYKTEKFVRDLPQNQLEDPETEERWRAKEVLFEEYSSHVYWLNRHVSDAFDMLVWAVEKSDRPKDDEEWPPEFRELLKTPGLT